MSLSEVSTKSWELQIYPIGSVANVHFRMPYPRIYW
jgi:hypothetical protein